MLPRVMARGHVEVHALLAWIRHPFTRLGVVLVHICPATVAD